VGKRVAPGIEKLGEQHYRIWWTEQGGRLRSKVFRGPLAQAKKSRRAILESIERREYVVTSKKTLRDFRDEYIRARRLKQDGSPGTLKRYESLLGGTLDEHLGWRRLQEIEDAHIDEYYLWALENEETRYRDESGDLRKVSPQTIIKRHQALKMLLKDAVRRREISKNPSDTVSPPPRRRPEGVAFEASEVKTILAAMEGGLAVKVRVAFFTGLRRSEVLGLRKTDLALDGDRPTITVSGKVLEGDGPLRWAPFPKSYHSKRTIDIDTETRDVLKAWLKEQARRRIALGRAWEHPELVFTTAAGRIVSPNDLSRDFRRVIVALAGDGSIETRGGTFHSTRHTHATILLKTGVRVSVVAERLGHKDEMTTLLYYSHVIPKEDGHAVRAFVDAIAAA
jgi:integrase